MKRTIRYAAALVFLLSPPLAAYEKPRLENPRIVLELAPAKNNPRNSEGDFIRLKNGDILLAYSHYTGSRPGDHQPAYIAGRISNDDGENWSMPFCIHEVDQGGMNLMSVSLLRLLDGRIALFYLRKYSLDDTRPFVSFSSDEAKSWSIPRPCIPDDEKGYYVVNNARVIQLNDGSILIPCALHPRSSEGKLIMDADILCFRSQDYASTFKKGDKVKNPENVTFQEPGIIQMDDGSLLMIIRTDAGCQYMARSRDGGRTWTETQKSPFISPLAPAQLVKIPATDKILAVWNENPAARNPLTMAVLNQNLEFVAKWTIDESEPSPQRWFCYPAIFHLKNGEFLLGYCAGLQCFYGLDTLRVKKFKLTWQNISNQKR